MLSDAKIRSSAFRLNPLSPLYPGLIYAGLGGEPGGTIYRDECGNTPTKLTSFANPQAAWKFDSTIQRWRVGFDGTGQASFGPMNLRYLPFTISLWLTVTSGDQFFGLGNYSTGQYLHLRTVGSNYLGLYGYFDDYYAAAANLTNAKWHHAAFTMDSRSKTKEIWYDGVKIGSTTATTTFASTVLSGAIGLDPLGGNGGLTGNIADFMVWGRVLSSSEIRSLAEATNPALTHVGIPLLLPKPRRLASPAAASGNRIRQVICTGTC